jgi:hypothetical protein
MSDQPSIRELVEAVRDFLERDALPELKDRTAFHGRVAVNALGIVTRELELGGRAGEGERMRLAQLLGYEGPREPLNRELCRRIRSGEIGIETPGLRAHLERTTCDSVAIDQPNYAGLKRARATRNALPEKDR